MRHWALTGLLAFAFAAGGCWPMGGGDKTDDGGDLYLMSSDSITMKSDGKDKKKGAKSSEKSDTKRIPNQKGDPKNDGKSGKKGKKAISEEEEEQGRREEAAVLYDEALDAIKERDYIRAETCLRKAVTLNDEDPRYWCDLGRVQYWRQNYGQAKTSYDKTLALLADLQPRDRDERQQLDGVLATVHANMGDMYREWNRPADALASYGEALRRAPRMIRLTYEMGNQYLKMGEYVKAEDCFNQVLNRVKDPSNQLVLKSHVGLAILYHMTDRNIKAYEQVTFIERHQFRVAPDLRAAIVRALERERQTDQFGSVWK